jgi:hypothetical protein
LRLVVATDVEDQLPEQRAVPAHDADVVVGQQLVADQTSTSPGC